MLEESADHVTQDHAKAVHMSTVQNTDLPHITEDCMTWPALQNALKKIYVTVTEAEWVAADHTENYQYLTKSNSLKTKVEGFDKMIKDSVDADGGVEFREQMWKVYLAWPISGDPTQVTRYNRKKMLHGEKKDAHKETWPLAFEGDESITSVLTECGWTEIQLLALSTALFQY